MIAPKAGREQVVAMAKAGKRPYDIWGELDHLALSTISRWINEARRQGQDIPTHSSAPFNRSAAHRGPLHRQEWVAPAWMTKGLTAEERCRLAELAARNVGLTGIAAQMRRPYAMIEEAIREMGLNRANVKISPVVR